MSSADTNSSINESRNRVYRPRGAKDAALAASIANSSSRRGRSLKRSQQSKQKKRKRKRLVKEENDYCDEISALNDVILSGRSGNDDYDGDLCFKSANRKEHAQFLEQHNIMVNRDTGVEETCDESERFNENADSKILNNADKDKSDYHENSEGKLSQKRKDDIYCKIDEQKHNDSDKIKTIRNILKCVV